MIFRWRTIFDTQPAHTKIIKWYIPLNDFSPVYHYLHTTGAFKILRSHLMISCFAQKWYFLQWFVAPVCPQDWSSKIYHLMMFRRCTTIYTQPAASKFWEATQWFLVLCKTYSFCNDLTLLRNWRGGCPMWHQSSIGQSGRCSRWTHAKRSGRHHRKITVIFVGFNFNFPAAQKHAEIHCQVFMCSISTL